MYKTYLTLQIIIAVIRPFFFFGLGFGLRQLFVSGLFPTTSSFAIMAVIVAIVFIWLFMVMDEFLKNKVNENRP